ncbi:tripartite-type tricarboxylate transporter receptor subunit TctC [Nocardioides albertanoniae]|uniref:Tripartite-type tricarboxylate transporter receptor subunit TctC n=1 Tax=Nocardioides albertanoniae TaxID=1175486 RepID=A0A543A4S2_9ACTN|nr:tripartite tricarboxylate transporter substrate binding protein [Nocardioides albertanoniae]TQL67599.1 tripartite-type tricarboxylate transporter receptor subunit TctC [Nocardioides albertanoniae]
MRTTTPLLVATAGVAALALSACGVSNTAGGSSGEEKYPSGNVEMYVGASPGGSSDLISRAVSKGLSDELGASFPVINQEGANGALAANKVSKAKADGQTIAIQNASLFAITPLAVSKDEVTDLDDFDVIKGVSRDDYVMVTGPKSGITSLDDIKKAKKKLTYGTTGVGTGAQVSCGLTYASAGADAEAVPFDGGAPALTAVLGNQVDTACLQVGEAIENIESGKLTPLSVFGPERVEYLPDVPTAQEQGLDVEVAQYRFMTVPKGTPDEVKDTVTEAMEATFETKAYQDFNKQNSLTPMELSGDEVVDQLEKDRKRFADLVEKYDLDLGAS